MSFKLKRGRTRFLYNPNITHNKRIKRKIKKGFTDMNQKFVMM